MEFAQWKASLYRDPAVGSEDIQHVLHELDGTAWTTGIESDKKKRGSAINIQVTSEDVWQGQTLALVQVREAVFHPNRFTSVHKQYFLVGRNENATAFAHPVKATIRNSVRQILARVWDCDVRDLDDIQRNGDVAFVPVRTPPAVLLPPVDPSTNSIIVAHSHKLVGNIFTDERGRVYVRKTGKLVHTKGQHPTAKVKEGLWRVAVAKRDLYWAFSRPTAD